MDDDDIWAASDDDMVDYDRNIAQREWDRMHTNHGNEGYKEGITEGKEQHMQRGFDRGYSEGLEVGKAIGKLRGIVSTHMTFYREMVHDQDKAQQLQALHDELCQVDVQHLFSKEYFQNDKAADIRAQIEQYEEKVKRCLDAVKK